MALKATQFSAPKNADHQINIKMMMMMMMTMRVLKKKHLMLHSKMLLSGGQRDKQGLKMRVADLDVDHIVVAKGGLITGDTG